MSSKHVFANMHEKAARAEHNARALACDHCGATETDENPLGMHHRDLNPTNNDLANLQVLCRSCLRAVIQAPAKETE